jgi:hypothetical protein
MQREAAGMATEIPTIRRVAEGRKLNNQRSTSYEVQLTDVAPYGSPVRKIVVPNYRVDKLIEACNGGPDHEKTSARIPGLQMPWKWDQNNKKAEESKEREERVGWI